MADRETYESRMARLRSATDEVPLPEGLVSRVVAGVERSADEPGLWDVLAGWGRWVLVPAACTPVAVGIAVTLAGSWLGEAVFVASSMGWVP